MQFLFIHHHLALGGIATLMARMSAWLIQHDHEVVVMFPWDGPGKELFAGSVRLLFLGNHFEKLKRSGSRYARHVIHTHFPLREFDALIAFSSPALWVAAGIHNALPCASRLCAGAWTPGDYSHTGLRGYLRDPGSFVFHRQLSPANRLYMSHQAMREIEARAGGSVPGAIWPLPVDGRPYQATPHRPVKGLIVSVGRLADMKTYNFHMVEVVRSLQARGLDIRWHIYGDGPDRPRLETMIAAAGLADRISLKGSIDYHLLPEVMRTAFVFVGMGTALIEAGFSGVPSIPAIVYAKDASSYGYLYDLPGYECGASLPLPRVPMATLIAKLYHMNSTEYSNESLLTQKHADRFALHPLMDLFQRHIAEMRLTKQVFRPACLCVLSQWLVSAYNSAPLVRVRRGLHLMRDPQVGTPACMLLSLIILAVRHPRCFGCLHRVMRALL